MHPFQKCPQSFRLYIHLKVDSSSINPVPSVVINIQWHIYGKRCTVDGATYIMCKKVPHPYTKGTTSLHKSTQNEIFYLIKFICIKFSGMLIAMLQTDQCATMPCVISITAWCNALLVQGQSVRSRQHRWHGGTDVHNVPHWCTNLTSKFHMQKSSTVEGAKFEVLAAVMHTNQGFKTVELCFWVNSSQCFKGW